MSRDLVFSILSIFHTITNPCVLTITITIINIIPTDITTTTAIITIIHIIISLLKGIF